MIECELGGPCEFWKTGVAARAPPERRFCICSNCRAVIPILQTVSESGTLQKFLKTVLIAPGTIYFGSRGCPRELEVYPAVLTGTLCNSVLFHQLKRRRFLLR